MNMDIETVNAIIKLYPDMFPYLRCLDILPINHMLFKREYHHYMGYENMYLEEFIKKLPNDKLLKLVLCL